jgi:UDP-2,4-diacetamido-2,4,6-trideoxy-beta-L-altropyranose hydrolase
MRVAFRIDASAQIGIGHAMRCLTLANALRADGARTRFVFRQIPDDLHARIRAKGHEVSVLAPVAAGEAPDDLPQARLLPTSQARDAWDSRAALEGLDWDWLVVDHYALDSRWESSVRDVARRIMVIDDAADRDHDCDLLLDQNLHENMERRYDSRVSVTTRRLLGPEFALLRPEFGELRSRVVPRDGSVRRVFVLFGGFDACNFTQRAVTALERAAPHGLRVDVVIGSGHPYRAGIEQECVRLGFDCHVQSEEIARLMAVADLAFGAGGSASWERCCLGLATLCVSFADNQRPISEALHKAGACIYAGDEGTATVGRLESLLRELLLHPSRLQQMSARAYDLVDGLGTARVSREIRELS